MRVIIVRHAKAEPGEIDALRPLSKKGRKRARETAEPIGRAAGVELTIDDRLSPGATVEHLRAAVAGRGETVVAVGHAPDCDEIVFALTGEEVHFPTGGTAEVEL